MYSIMKMAALTGMALLGSSVCYAGPAPETGPLTSHNPTTSDSISATLKKVAETNRSLELPGMRLLFSTAISATPDPQTTEVNYSQCSPSLSSIPTFEQLQNPSLRGGLARYPLRPDFSARLFTTGEHEILPGFRIPGRWVFQTPTLNSPLGNCQITLYLAYNYNFVSRQLGSLDSAFVTINVLERTRGYANRFVIAQAVAQIEHITHPPDQRYLTVLRKIETNGPRICTIPDGRQFLQPLSIQGSIHSFLDSQRVVSTASTPTHQECLVVASGAPSCSVRLEPLPGTEPSFCTRVLSHGTAPVNRLNFINQPGVPVDRESGR